MPSDLLTVSPAKAIAPLSVGLRDAARLLGLSERTVWDLAKSGELPSVQAGGPGSKILFRVATLDRWLEDRERGGTGSATRRQE